MNTRGNQKHIGNQEIDGNLTVTGTVTGGTGLDATSAEINALHDAGAVGADFVKLHAVTASKDELNILDGVTATKNELNLVDNLPASVGFTIAQGASSGLCEITLQAKDAAGVAMARACLLMVHLSGDPGGVGLTTVSASGNVQAKAASGTDMGILTAKKCLLVQTKADGAYILSLTDSAKTAFYVAATPLLGGAPSVSRALTTNDYGA